MKFSAFVLFASLSSAYAACSSPGTLTCSKTDSAPTLDANLSDWSSVSGGIDTDMFQTITGTKYAFGTSSFKCLYDDTNIYLSMEIPGAYRFNETADELCAAIGTMMKIGADATFINMGGCPLAASGCANGVEASCANYVVDIGAHWELSTTKQGVKYDLNVENYGENTTTNDPGNDPIANKDDEYAASAFCRFDDNDVDAGNEWSGAWAHTNSTDGASGKYIFELSRLLVTNSTVSDAQLKAGQAIDFGIAYWDPNQIEESGWTDSGHYTTGCGTDWIKLVLATSGTVGTSFFVPIIVGMSLWIGFIM